MAPLKAAPMAPDNTMAANPSAVRGTSRPRAERTLVRFMMASGGYWFSPFANRNSPAVERSGGADPGVASGVMGDANATVIPLAEAAAVLRLPPAAVVALVDGGYLVPEASGPDGPRFRLADLKAFVARNTGTEDDGFQYSRHLQLE